MPTFVVPYRGADAKRRLEPLPEETRAALAEAMLEDVVAACEGAGGSVVVARHGDQGEAVEAAIRGVESGPILVVNADLPCAQPARPARAPRRACPRAGSRSSRPRRDDERARARVAAPVRAALRAGQRRAVSRRGPRGSAPLVRPPRCPSSSTTSTRVADLERARRATRPADGGRARRASRRAHREGRAARRRLGGARFARALTETLDPGGPRSSGTSATTSRCSGLHVSPDLDTSSTRSPGVSRRGARLGPRGRDLERAATRCASSAPRRGSSSATATSGCTWRAPRRCARGEPLSAVTARSPRASGSRRSCCPPPTTACARGWRRPPGASRSRSGSCAAATRTRSTASASRAPATARPAPGVLDALEAADLIAIAPSNPFVSIGPILAVGGDPRRARAPARPRASPSAR